MRCRVQLFFAAVLLSAGTATLHAAETGFKYEVRIGSSTRLDWEFAVTSFSDAPPQIPGDYDSRKQRYQLFVPKNYDRDRAWPLVVFISPGDDPAGWRYWQKSCEELGMFFCAAYGAGNIVPADQRTRIILDMLDDVRRRYRIDPEQTYLTGFSGGGRMACGLALALPEYFGGVIAMCGTHPLHKLPYLRHRVRDRISVAFVTGSEDFNRKENEDYMAPYFHDLGIRSRLWVVPKMGHTIPGPEVLTECIHWLAEDLKRRRADVKDRAGFAADPEEVRTAEQQATRLVEIAEADLKRPERVWSAVALLEGVQKRWPDTGGAVAARKVLAAVRMDADKVLLLDKQKGAEEGRDGQAQAKALERFGLRKKAIAVWQRLAEQYPDTDEGKKAAAEVKRLEDAIAGTPKQAFLGLSFKGETLVVGQVTRAGPADTAGIKPGDTLVALGDAKTPSLAELLKALRQHKPGDEVAVALRRGDKVLTLAVKLGSRNSPGDE